jgi:hypothetical protein
MAPVGQTDRQNWPGAYRVSTITRNPIQTAAAEMVPLRTKSVMAELMER